MTKKKKGLPRRKFSLNRFVKKVVLWVFLLALTSLLISSALVFLIAKIVS